MDWRVRLDPRFSPDNMDWEHCVHWEFGPYIVAKHEPNSQVYIQVLLHEACCLLATSG